MRRTLVVAAAVPALLLLGAAGASATPQTDPDRFTRCLHEHGVDVAEPVLGVAPTWVPSPAVVISSGTAGVDVVTGVAGEPPVRGGGPDVAQVDPAVPEELRAALEACGQYAPRRDIAAVPAVPAELLPAPRAGGVPDGVGVAVPVGGVAAGGS